MVGQPSSLECSSEEETSFVVSDSEWLTGKEIEEALIGGGMPKFPLLAISILQGTSNEIFETTWVQLSKFGVRKSLVGTFPHHNGTMIIPYSEETKRAFRASPVNFALKCREDQERHSNNPKESHKCDCDGDNANHQQFLYALYEAV